MDNIILGLLFLCNKTIYQLRDRINKGLNLMYSSSMGSIQAAVRKLLNAGDICYEETVENGKYKKIYCITESGRRHFLEWINTPIEEHGIKSPELTKVYFMGFADKENRETAIETHLTFLRGQYSLLSKICEESKDIRVPEEHKDIFHYQMMSALYGRDLIKFNISWFESLLNKIRDID
ncbi:MAG: PadR family transcriptional regulator [Acetatifactor sp.]|nr:PadR family transcriptional regulator [Acetatifactor sp.]